MPRAKRRCGHRGCDKYLPCPVHTPAPWAGSDRRSTLPSNWSSLTKFILDRDPTCRIAYPGEWLTKRGTVRCTVTSTEVDHWGHRLDHRPEMLRGVCHNCHSRRTQEQAQAARG